MKFIKTIGKAIGTFFCRTKALQIALLVSNIIIAICTTPKWAFQYLVAEEMGVLLTYQFYMMRGK